MSETDLALLSVTELSQELMARRRSPIDWAEAHLARMKGRIVTAHTVGFAMGLRRPHQ